MKYNNIIHGIFHSRPNRFLAQVYVDGVLETVHVKNTGRCKELLLPGAEVILEVSDNPSRKTKYDLIAVYKEGLGLVNIDSQLCNKVAAEWLAEKEYDFVKAEYTYGASRFDFYMEKGDKQYLMEVKGCTLEIDGIGYFPDAPTERGVKHLRELTEAVKQGYHCSVAFVIPMEGVTEVRANVATHKAFGDALEEAKQAGVEVLFLPCRVLPEEVWVSLDWKKTGSSSAQTESPAEEVV
ncbi:MAG: DNA/RNA nuclease SfsA [Lachnospiraceae bacterium]|nr:DNA/RNA nuclease SfsA [Lachnospiraceae bacterium]